jgi:acetyl esterase
VHGPLDIHPELRSVGAHSLPSSSWALAAVRNLLAAVNAVHRQKFRSIITRTRITSSDGYPVPVLIIRPEHLRPLAPALVYYHGGAFIMKPAPQHLENAVQYARGAECIVFFVEYRLAPKHPFPAGFNDCYAALQSLISSADKLGIDTKRVLVGGDSAGGGLAAGVAQRAWQEDRITLCGQLLIYPCVDLVCTRPSMAAFADVPPFKQAPARSVAQMYLGHSPAEAMPRYASPIYGDVTDLAPAYVETAQFDILHDQGTAYAHAMRAKGVVVELNEIKGGIHGFDVLAAHSGVAKDAMRRRIQFLRRVTG